MTIMAVPQPRLWESIIILFLLLLLIICVCERERYLSLVLAVKQSNGYINDE